MRMLRALAAALAAAALLTLGLTGSASASGGISPESFNFDPTYVGQTDTQQLEVFLATGEEVGLISGSGLNTPFDFDIGTCDTAVGDTTCVMTVSFSPTEKGVRHGELFIERRNGDDSTFDHVTFSGEGFVPTDLAISIIGPDKPKPGKQFSFTVLATNNSEDFAAAARLKTVLPSSPTAVKFVSLVLPSPDHGDTCHTIALGASGTVSCDFTLQPGQTRRYIVTVEVPKAKVGTRVDILNTLSITDGNTVEPDTTDNSQTLTVSFK